ncbi:CATRA system-associated protein [Streptomyces acidicola]|uniref:CATRA system-associated protein n=1 Tax=Streptomyces acidicola TaxID=2596892 RepID=UPI0037F3CDD5
MSDWSDALRDARFLLGTLSGTALAEPAVWTRLEVTLADLESALDDGDADRLRLALYTLEDSLAGDRMRMLGGPDTRTPPPPPLADRLDRLVHQIRVPGARNEGASASPGSNAPADSTGSADDDAT